MTAEMVPLAMPQPRNLMQGLAEEMVRVTRLACLYRSIGPGGVPAALLMEQDVETAIEVLSTADVVNILQMYQHLQRWEDA